MISTNITCPPHGGSLRFYGPESVATSQATLLTVRLMACV